MRFFYLPLIFLFSLLRGQTLVKGPYLQIGTPTSMTIRWETNVKTSTKVEWGTSASSLSSFTGSSLLDSIHEVQLVGLTPYTKYYYTIGTTTSVIQGDTNNYFITSPLPHQEGKYRFWVTGDCGNLSANQMNCKTAYNAYNGNRITNGWLLLGDNAYYYGTNSEYNAEFFAVYQTDIMKHSLLWPNPGNHDYNNGATTTPTVPYFSIFSTPAFAQAGGVASGTERYYSFDYGNIHFISLDSYGTDGNFKMYDTTSAQSIWLRQDLFLNNKKWTVAFWHHPPYTLGSHNSDTELDLDSIRVNFIRLLERNNVDLILCGHSHVYERSKLMKGHYGKEATFSPLLHNIDTSTALYNGSANSCPYIKDTISKKAGTVYVVSGSAGQLPYTMQSGFPHNAMYYSDALNGGSVVLDVEENRLDLKWLCADTTIRDKFTMFKNVNKVSSFTITATQTIALNASWPGNYVWSNTDTTRTSVVSPTINTTYWVKDKFNCIADTFKISVTPVGIKEAFKKEQTLFLYPNPTSENIILKLNLKAHADVGMKLYSSDGKLIKEYDTTDYEAGENNIRIWLKDLKLNNGLYFLEAVIDGVRVTDRFILTK